MQNLTAGANIAIDSNAVKISIDWSPQKLNGCEVDVAAFLLQADEKVRGDDDFVFYNQPVNESQSLQLSNAGNSKVFMLALNKVPAAIEKIAFTISIAGEASFAAAKTLKIGLENIADFSPQTQAMQEKALILGELYRRNQQWKFRAIGQGFNGGLAPLAMNFGVDINQEDETPATAESKAAESPAVNLEKKIAAQKPRLVNLAKVAGVCLEKKKLLDVRAQVGFVLDASGSMSQQFSSGNVQAVVDRIVTLAVHFDDDGQLDAWGYASSFKKLEAISLANVDDYIKRITEKKEGGFFRRAFNLNIIEGLGCGNNEPPVMQDVLETYQSNSQLPAYIVFITDGGIYLEDKIRQILLNASSHPIFWQFVGLGGSDYGILERLDDMEGRVVDNADFFHIDDFRQISDEQLYERLLNEFPGWLKTVKREGMLTG